MKLIYATIFNYKSFANKMNKLFVSDLNVVVGKNESGKSNLIEALGGLSTIGSMDKTYFAKKNKNLNDSVRLELTFLPESNDINLYKYSNPITLNISGYRAYDYDESFGNFLVNHPKMKKIITEIKEFKETNKIPISKPENLKVLNQIYDGIENTSSRMLLVPNDYSRFIGLLKNSDSPILNTLAILFEDLFKVVNEFYSCFPTFIALSSKNIKSSYSLTDFEEEIALEQDSILFQFLKISDISFEELNITMNSSDASLIKNNSDKFNKLIDKNITREFNKFYKQEVVDVFLSISNNTLNILIKTKGVYLDYEERSNGLKWYFSLFIQLLFKNKKDISNTILLLDEPGVFLHAIAQQELLKLFELLVQGGNQIIYTTHSPAMIDFNNIQNIRAVEKDENGNSFIYNKLSEIPGTSKSKYETITPIIRSMGYQLSLNVGVNYENLNIIVEGITDYFFLNTYLSIKKLNDYNIIASTGADNIPAIASILYGWGCNFVVLLDHDDKGRSVYDTIKDSNMPFLNHVMFIDGKAYDKKVHFETENLFDDIDKDVYGINSSDYKEKKYFYSYAMLEKIKNEQSTLTKQSLYAFHKIFEEINKFKQK